ncbi:DedA family protein [Crassaminicella indica]|uniref:DedA family protein n=1 Tax=Crassaminicella indica TaxID=2855394 RepID=A0ABX8RC13_9CLOT|nr:DedA family protein [Crassaminicella indica]QXM06597.1 DedA family protein [Crassaminicella indica]
MLQEKVLYLITIYGYIGIFLALVFGIIGLPIPDEVLLTFAGFLVTKGKMDFFSVVCIAFIGSIIGVSVSYMIGYCLGWPFLEKYGKFLHIKEKSFNKVEKWFDKYGKYAIVIGYFIPGVRQLNAYYAGITKRPYMRFAFYANLGGLLWVTTFVTLGVFVGERWELWVKNFHRVAVALLLIICVSMGIYYLLKKKNK